MSGEDLKDAVKRGNLSEVQRLVGGNKSIVNSTDYSGNTAFFWACNDGHLEIAQFLVENGANPLLKNKRRWTPFHAAARNNRPSLVRFLISLKLNPFELYEGKTPRERAVEKNRYGSHTEVISLLRQYEAEFKSNYGTYFGLFLQDYDQYKQALQAVHQDEDQARLLQSANEGRVEEVGELLSSREVREWNKIIFKGAWMSSAWKGHGDVFRLFVEAGVDVNKRDDRGQALIHLASAANNRHAVRALCENGADINLVDQEGQVPSLIAYRENNTEIEALLKDFGADMTEVEKERHLRSSSGSSGSSQWHTFPNSILFCLGLTAQLIMMALLGLGYLITYSCTYLYKKYKR